MNPYMMNESHMIQEDDYIIVSPWEKSTQKYSSYEDDDDFVVFSPISSTEKLSSSLAWDKKQEDFSFTGNSSVVSVEDMKSDEVSEENESIAISILDKDEKIGELRADEASEVLVNFESREKEDAIYLEPTLRKEQSDEGEDVTPPGTMTTLTSRRRKKQLKTQVKDDTLPPNSVAKSRLSAKKRRRKLKMIKRAAAAAAALASFEEMQVHQPTTSAIATPNNSLAEAGLMKENGASLKTTGS